VKEQRPAAQGARTAAETVSDVQTPVAVFIWIASES
jgi:hypothetical protein